MVSCEGEAEGEVAVAEEEDGVFGREGDYWALVAVVIRG